MKNRQVFRVENGNGDGPYQTGIVERYYNVVSTARHPTPHIPQCDNADSPWYRIESEEERYFCGFNFIQQLVNWFGTLRFSTPGEKTIEAKPFRVLQKKGFRVAVFQVSNRPTDCLQSSDGLQCVFKRNSTRTKYLTAFPLTMARHIAMMPEKQQKAILGEL